MGTLVNGTFDLRTHVVLPGGFHLPEALFQAANVTVSFENGGCEHVPATEPLKRFFDSGYHYLCFQDLRRPDNYFVLCLSGERNFYYCTTPPPETWNFLGSAHDSATPLRDLFVGPGMNVFLAHQHPQPGLLRRLQTLPHFRDSVAVKLQHDNGSFVYIVFAHNKLVSYNSGFLNTVLAAEDAPSRLENGADLDLNVDICPKMRLDLNVDICPKMRFTRMAGDITNAMRLSFVDGDETFASRLPDLEHMAVVAAFKQGERLRAFVYQVDGDSRVSPSPCAEGILEKGVVGSFSAYQGMAIPLHLLGRVFRQDVTCTLEQFRVSGLRFECSPRSTLEMMDHGCSLTQYQGSLHVVWRDSMQPPAAPKTSDKIIPARGMKILDRPTDENCLVNLLAVYYWGENTPLPPAVQMPREGAEIVAIAATELWSPILLKQWPTGMTLTASQANVMHHVNNGVNGLVPALKITMYPGERVQTFGERVSRMLWRDKELHTFNLRNGQGGPFGILGQMPGSNLEIAIIMVFERNERKRNSVKPKVAYRLSNASAGFALYERQDLASLPCAFLGFHLPKVCLTVFRVKQSGSADKKWLKTLCDVGTLIKPLSKPGIVTRPRRVLRSHASPAPIAQLEEPDNEPLEGVPVLPKTPSVAGFVKNWPLVGANLLHLYDFGATRTFSRERQAYTQVYMEHVLSRKGQQKPSYFLVVIMNSYLIEFLPSSTIAACDALSVAWREKHARLRHSQVPSWGNFKMEIQPWYDGHAYNDTLDMESWVVKVPTEEQWRGWNVDQRLELVARLHGFHVFYVNWIRTNGTTPPLSDYHAIIEHISPKLGLLQSSKWPVCEDVINGKRQTRSFNEMTMDAPVMFETIIANIVGKPEFVAHVIEQSVVTQHNDLSLPVAIQGMSQSIHNTVKSLAMLHPSYTFFPLLDLRRHLEACSAQLEMVRRPVAVAGESTSGKSMLLSSIASLHSAAAAAPPPFVDDAESRDDISDFVALFNSMGPETPLDPALLNGLLIDFGTKLENEATVNDTHNLDVLFGMPAENKSTARVTSAVRLLSQGNQRSTTSHVSTRLLNADSISKDTIKLHIRTWPEMEKIADVSRDFERWMKKEADLLQRLAGKVLTLTLPGGYTTEVGQRGQMEALFNLIHGVCHKDIHADLGSDNCRIMFPGAIRLIELARPMTSSLPAFQDFIGLGETDNTLFNPDLAHNTWIVPFTHPSGFFTTAMNEALDAANLQSSRHVVAVYNYAKGKNAGIAEVLKPPTYLAQTQNSVDDVVAKVKKTYQAYIGKQLEVVAFDGVSATAMMMYLKRGKLVHVEHLRNLPMSIQASGLGEFLYATHNAHVLGVLDVVEYEARVRQSLEVIKQQWQFSSFPATLPPVDMALRLLPASDLMKPALAFAFKGNLRKSSLPSLSPEVMELLGSLPQTTKTSVGNLAPFSEQKIMDLLETMEDRARAIESLDLFYSKVTTRRADDDPFCALRRVLYVLEQRGELPEGADVAEYIRVKGECLAVYRDLTVGLVYACLEDSTTAPYDEVARHLKSVAVEAGVLFLRMSCLCLKDVTVDLKVSPPSEDDEDLPITEAFEKQVRICGVSVQGQKLQGTALKDHVAVFQELGKYAMHRVVEQMGISTLKVETFPEPTVELVAKTLLHFLRCRRRFAEIFHKMQGLQDVGQIVTLLRYHLVRTFERYPDHATPLRFEQADAHPGVFVTSDGAKRTEERETIAAAMVDQGNAILDRVPTFVQDAVLSTRLLELIVEMSESIMSVERGGLVCNNHFPFPGFYLGKDEVFDFPLWSESLQLILNSPPLAVVEAPPYLDAVMADVGNRRGVNVMNWTDFSTMRETEAHILGMQCDYIKSKEEFSGIVQDKKLEDQEMRPFRRDFLEAKDEEGEVAAALDRVYAAYVAKNSLDLGALVKSMGMTIAHLLPTQWAYLFPGGRAMPYRYLPTTGAAPLRPQTCMTTTNQLKPRRALGVSGHMYAHLEGQGTPTLAEVRDRLQTYTSTGEDLFYCILFELTMISITRKRAISVMIYEDDAEGFKVHEHIIRPKLTLQASETCKEKLAGSVHEKKVGDGRECDFGPKDTPEELEVIVWYKGQFCVCEGSFVGTARSLEKRAREEGWTEEKEGGDKKAREEVDYVQRVFNSFQCDEVVSDLEGGHGEKACGENGTTAREESELESDLPYSSPNNLGLDMDEITAMLNGDM